MLITYERPDTLGMQIDPAAPPADLDPTGAECEATTYGVGGIEWHCTRRPGHTDDEHRAAFDIHGGGPTGEVGFAWQYEWGGAGHGPSSAEAMTTVTVTRPVSPVGVDERAAARAHRGRGAVRVLGVRPRRRRGRHHGGQ
jgi:hypothetical protein